MAITLSKPYPSRYGLPVVDGIDTDIFSTRYPSFGCMGMHCNDICCSGGAVMDIIAFNKLKAFSGCKEFEKMVWEGLAFEKYPYYPGGMGCYTPIVEGMCIFKNRASRGCGIHSLCVKNGIEVRELKFFACCIFPVEVNRVQDEPHILTVGYELRHEGFDFDCKFAGDSTVYECAREDIDYYFGRELVDVMDEVKNRLLMHAYGRKEDVNSWSYF
jgi:hypothetical protein